MGEDSFSALKEAAGEQEPKVQKLVSEILDDIDIYQSEKEELKAVLGCIDLIIVSVIVPQRDLLPVYLT